ncbi:PREDICTED: liprin-beta-2 [Rhagoletis zephyria]|uniref:liprin-beta-2 n=1 Tax=Rhagoletis zephyria TaxID=28612 RepID=UPI000811501B|nr:PREDICTED: liprin-beta-2 [Rhagoletis zephyria]XP_017466010.1 PREDICTED: liprin-beta-2 [Rhagoletis zephyria]XP_017466011.1 PREDICTED: liprin-beta-2 [Rhagoletis zephyria]
MQGIKARSLNTSGVMDQEITVANKAKSSGEGSTDASKMLEAALEQMDGIISGSSNVSASVSGNGVKTLTTASASVFAERSLISANNVLSTAKTLALALQQVGLAAPSPEPAIAAVIADWLETHIPRQDADERLRRLQRDKEALALQYQLLADRVAEQTDKIIELEGLLNERTQLLSEREEQLQRQMLSKSTLETQKLELMSALSELKLHRAALERENVELRGLENQIENLNSNNASIAYKRPPFGSVGNLNQTNFSGSGSVGSPKTPPASLRHQIHPQYHSLPRTHNTKHSSNNNNNHHNLGNLGYNRTIDANANMQRQRNVAFASNEKILIEDSKGTLLSTNNDGSETREDPMYSSIISNTNSTPSPNFREKSAKGLRGIFGKLRRSNSGNLELPSLECADAEFKRGGVARATAGGRIEWTTHSPQLSTSSKGYTEWSPQEVCNWLTDLGLGCYADDCRKWLKANSAICFFTVSPVDIERELNLKSALHRKKIQLAIDELTGKEEDPLALKAAQLDISWVMRWLDDIGLPQYKDPFLTAKIDGRMLHRLTMEDLAQLHVYSCLHIASLRCGIQCMREIEWNAECLIRRSAKSVRPASEADEQSLEEDYKSLEDSGEKICLWTAHRVMEWLRVADLSEYAPNLRGAGVHGALMLYEPRFTADLLADLLSIPPSKTLLRRHLATHFKELLGRDVIQNKRDVESAPGYLPLTITSKLKPPKKTQFSLKRRKSYKGCGDVDWTDYVCPMMSLCLSSNNQDKSLSTSDSSSSGAALSFAGNTNNTKEGNIGSKTQ